MFDRVRLPESVGTLAHPIAHTLSPDPTHTDSLSHYPPQPHTARFWFLVHIVRAGVLTCYPTFDLELGRGDDQKQARISDGPVGVV